MKIRFIKNWCGEIQKTRLRETWDISYNRWNELRIERIDTQGKTACLITEDGDVLMDVPMDTYKVIQSTDLFRESLTSGPR
jgi:hypothetical protein